MRALFTLAALAVAFGTTPAYAQVLCGPPGEIAERLTKTYGETMRGYGLDQHGNHVQLFVSPTGRWTLTIRPPNKMTCLSQWGIEWHIFGPAYPEASHGDQDE